MVGIVTSWPFRAAPQATAAAGKPARRGHTRKGPSPEDPIENTGPSGKEALPDWMEEADRRVRRRRAGGRQDRCMLTG